MYHKAYGIIETLAPLHVGASAGEETGNLNLIFRDQFTQTGIIPGSSIRGRFRADMRVVDSALSNDCYGHEAISGKTDSTTEALIKFEYASLVWLPVFCPGQPVVWITCPRLLRRYRQIAQIPPEIRIPNPYNVQLQKPRRVLFFNLGFLKNLKAVTDLAENWVPKGLSAPPDNLVVVDDKDIGIIHEMSLYRQTRVKLADDEKKVDDKAFFNVEALPEGSILVFPIAVKEKQAKHEDWLTALEFTEWQAITDGQQQAVQKSLGKELYFGGLESIGFGRCNVTLAGKYFSVGATDE
ncbi:MAG: type III-B CRISPR module RAMP protein Cmr4 [Tildeniella nuda ZEHNDER 1965/U140]|jgi:CRISPR-associated protein Cmr4|nr:type III-B CRISPR module RAMP protein Cmr4 [Tildeniella nuda ZEHNDER 1965/U140]